MAVYKGRRRGTWRVVLWHQNKPSEWIVEGTRREALVFEADQRLELKATAAPQRARVVPGFSSFCVETYKPHAKTHLGRKTWDTRKYQLATLCKHLGDISLDQVAERVDDYKRARQKDVWKGRPVKNSSINAELTVLRTVMLFAAEMHGRLVPKIKIKMLPESGTRRVRVWTADEVRRLYVAAKGDPELLDMLVFLLNTGCRKGEALAAEWSWVDWDAKMLRIPVTEYWRPKDKTAREVPIGSTLLEMLTRRRAPALHVAGEHSGTRSWERSERWIFPNALSQRFTDFPGGRFRRVTSLANIKGGPHTTRHTYASHFLQRRPDLPLLAEVLGHTKTKVTELYAHLLPGHLDLARGAVELAPASFPWRRTMAKTKDPSKTPEN